MESIPNYIYMSALDADVIISIYLTHVCQSTSPNAGNGN